MLFPFGGGCLDVCGFCPEAKTVSDHVSALSARARKGKKKETGKGWGNGRGDSDVRRTGIKNEKDSWQEPKGTLKDQGSKSDRKFCHFTDFSTFSTSVQADISQRPPSRSSHLGPSSTLLFSPLMLPCAPHQSHLLFILSSCHPPPPPLAVIAV